MLRFALVFLALSGPVLAAETPVAPAELSSQITAGTPPRILDVRSQEEFDAGHVPGAILIPHDQLEARINELGAPGEIVVYCRTGHRSGLAEPVLESHGFRVHQLAGSWQAWQAAGLPEVKLAEAATSKDVEKAAPPITGTEK